MANSWFRVWVDMPFDPKWKTIARLSKQPISTIQATYLQLLACASNATERGRTHGAKSRDIASSLDVETQDIDAILAAMQGVVLDGDMLTGWDKRQPLKEDGAAERAKQWREAKKEEKNAQPNATERNRTQPNAEKRPDTDTDTDTEYKNQDQKHYTTTTPKPLREARHKSAVSSAPKINPVQFLIDAGVGEDVSRDFLALRKSKRAPLTETAWKTIAAEIESAGITPHQALEICCARGWQSFRAEWLSKSTQNQTNGGNYDPDLRNTKRQQFIDELTGSPSRTVDGHSRTVHPGDIPPDEPAIRNVIHRPLA